MRWWWLGVAVLVGCGDSLPAGRDAAILDAPSPDAPVGSPQLNATPDPSDFGTVRAAQGSASRTLTITNTGTAASGAITTSLTGANASDFARTADVCTGVSLASGASCTVDIMFMWASSGTKTATLVATASGGASAQASLIVDALLGGPAITASPSQLVFGDQAIGTTSASRSFTVSNESAITTGTITVTPSGANPTSFSITHDCTMLAPSTSCTVTVTFHPTAIGSQTAAVNVTASPGASASVALVGTGTAAAD